MMKLYHILLQLLLLQFPFKVEYFQIYVSHFNISYNGTAWGHEELVKQWIDNKLTLISKELFNEQFKNF